MNKLNNVLIGVLQLLKYSVTSVEFLRILCRVRNIYFQCIRILTFKKLKIVFLSEILIVEIKHSGQF